MSKRTEGVQGAGVKRELGKGGQTHLEATMGTPGQPLRCPGPLSAGRHVATNPLLAW